MSSNTESRSQITPAYIIHNYVIIILMHARFNLFQY